MKTKSGEGAATRSAIARLSNATALETFNGDIDFLTNKGMFDRLTDQDKKKAEKGEKDSEDSAKGGNIAQSEIHRSFYSYTLSVDLDKVGIDTNGAEPVEIANQEKYNRVALLLKAVKFLYRDIRGRREDLAPLFIIGGVYDIKNPFFMNVVKLDNHKLTVPAIQNVLDKDDHIKENSLAGYVQQTFKNDDDIAALNPTSMKEFFTTIDTRLNEYYNG